MHFSAPLTVTKIDERQWRVEHEFTYFIDTDEKEHVRIPKGFITDFASVPRLFWNIFPPDGTYTQAAVLHDFMYFTKMFDRSKCDDIFLEAMKTLGCGYFTRYTIYWAVRSFGWIGWKRLREDQPSIQRFKHK